MRSELLQNRELNQFSRKKNTQLQTVNIEESTNTTIRELMTNNIMQLKIFVDAKGNLRTAEEAIFEAASQGIRCDYTRMAEDDFNRIMDLIGYEFVLD